MSLKSELIEYFSEGRHNYDQEEIKTVLSIIKRGNDDLSNYQDLDGLDRNLICRLLEDDEKGIELYNRVKIKYEHKDDRLNNLFDE
ncbi:MAG TPA: hypothetical protein VI815_02850 [Candidatus Nanoarchaeia archaeon]|nr:hypothetical protein [Candidatus Nanoarchaeia archaeon]